MEAGATLSEVPPEEPLERLGVELGTDEGCFVLEPIGELQACGKRTVITDPQAGRCRRERLSAQQRHALRRASAATGSKSGKALLRARGEHRERGFAHTLDCGGLRRATLRGRENLTKRQLRGAMTPNLSLLMRRLFGVGTPKQALASAHRLIFARH